ncbi:MAG: hypothetical protein O2887_17995 [Bacteroidetes bacterium]|nr:hypothetical protein [Bacteroidota bacterium]MDA1122348.1 hypothetical protein [Bacteroidota bacterium]
MKKHEINTPVERVLLFEETKIIDEFTFRMHGFASSVEDLRTIQPFESWDGLYELRDELNQHKSNDGVQ